MRRVAVIILAVGLVFPASASAVSGVSVGGNAAQVVYPKTTSGETLGQEGQGNNPTLVKGEEAAGSNPTVAGATGSSGSQSLPFTGFLVIGSLLTGVAMLAAGAAFRRSVTRSATH